MAILARQLVEEANQYLLDDGIGYDGYEFEHWTEDELLNYFRLAVEVVASVERNEFIKRTTVKLQSGRVQHVPSDCRSEVKVVGQIGKSGMVETFPRQSSMAGNHLLGRVGCTDCRVSPKGDYLIDSWQADADDPSVFYVDPPVPDGVNAAIELSCFVPPTVDGMDSVVDFGAHLRPAIFELMLYYAYGRDIESVPFRDRSATHFNNAVQYLGVEASANNKYSGTRVPELRTGSRK